MKAARHPFGTTEGGVPFFVNVHIENRKGRVTRKAIALALGDPSQSLKGLCFLKHSASCDVECYGEAFLFEASVRRTKVYICFSGIP